MKFFFPNLQSACKARNQIEIESKYANPSKSRLLVGVVLVGGVGVVAGADEVKGLDKDEKE